ncbi:MAG: hypothetical protein K2X43_06130 [Hyphomonadaceae bacterium]|jgi:hypothetical protein|nr:hypothetical protein [Hyphomonadaceae bacterium]
MMRVVCRRPRSVLFTCAALFTAMVASVSAASIFERATPFQACLDGRLETWVNARAALVVNEDPAAGDIDDAAVARWAIEALEACRTQAGGADEASQARFTKHVAHWRQHIYDRVQAIRERTRPD